MPPGPSEGSLSFIDEGNVGFYFVLFVLVDLKSPSDAVLITVLLVPYFNQCLSVNSSSLKEKTPRMWKAD